MNSPFARRFFGVILGLGWLLCATGNAEAQTNSGSADAAMQQAEREGCTRNLKLIYDAIQAYQMDHKDLPNWLSDLVPQYLSDANVLVCPVCKRTGQTEAPPLADPNLPCSYLYEFCPLPLNKPLAAANVTRREWKRRQMGMVGAAVPIVRCRHHTPLLNLAFDGRIYDSPGDWEVTVSNRIDPKQLSAEILFPPGGATNSSTNGAPAKKPPPKLHFPKRDENATYRQINLVNYYNATLTQSWHGGTSNNLATLPTGLQTFDGVEFDVRGIVQLGGKSQPLKKFPAEITGIKIRQRCKKLNFLQAVAMGSLADDGKTIGSYIVHYATNRVRVDIPINYGEDVRDWHVLPKEKPAPELTVAWSGTNANSNTGTRDIRLFKTTWTNITPDIQIESIDFVSAMGTSAPFLVSITTE